MVLIIAKYSSFVLSEGALLNSSSYALFIALHVILSHVNATEIKVRNVGRGILVVSGHSLLQSQGLC